MVACPAACLDHPATIGRIPPGQRGRRRAGAGGANPPDRAPPGPSGPPDGSSRACAGWAVSGRPSPD